jgi:NodT family efflux transporter outer membrane factor (OMF) lipoprotein
MTGRVGRACASLLALAVAGCTVGPDFVRPQAAMPASFVPAEPGTAASQPVAAAIAVNWWTIFADPVLASLEARLANDNLDVRSASARLLQSRAQRRVSGAGRYPGLTGGASYQRERASAAGILALTGVAPTGEQTQSASGTTAFGVSSLPGSDGSPAFDLWQGGFDASWEIDLWGGVRRTVEAADASVSAAAEDRRDVLVAAQAELARDYMDLRAAQTQLAIAEQNLVLARNSVTLTQLRMDNGATTRLDVANASALVAAIGATMPSLEAQRDALINAIGLLLGEQPRALTATLGATGMIPAVPTRIPIGFPSELARRRPDIRRAEARLHVATASIGVAKADFYPRISLNGSLGQQGLQLSDLGNWSSHQFVVGPSISLPFFQGGRMKGTLELRKAQQQEAAIGYQHVVLTAWSEIDDALIAYAGEQRRRDLLAEAVRQEQVALDVAQKRYRQGAIDYLNVLSVQRALLQGQTDLAASAAAVGRDLVGLYKALGGGWQDSFPEPQPVQSASK